MRGGNVKRAEEGALFFFRPPLFRIYARAPVCVVRRGAGAATPRRGVGSVASCAPPCRQTLRHHPLRARDRRCRQESPPMPSRALATHPAAFRRRRGRSAAARLHRYCAPAPLLRACTAAARLHRAVRPIILQAPSPRGSGSMPSVSRLRPKRCLFSLTPFCPHVTRHFGYYITRLFLTPLYPTVEPTVYTVYPTCTAPTPPLVPPPLPPSGCRSISRRHVGRRRRPQLCQAVRPRGDRLPDAPSGHFQWAAPPTEGPSPLRSAWNGQDAHRQGTQRPSHTHTRPRRMELPRMAP